MRGTECPWSKTRCWKKSICFGFKDELAETKTEPSRAYPVLHVRNPRRIEETQELIR